MKMQFQEVFIDVLWGKMAALVGGDPEGKPVLGVHGTLDSANSLIPLVNRLPGGFWYVLIDLPGCGKSDPFPRGNALQLIQFIVPLKIWIDHFKLTNITYIGHSFGAALGLYFYLRYPNLIERLVCIDAIHSATIDPEMFSRNIEHYYDDFYNPKKYQMYNAISPSPTYTYDQVLELLMKARGLTKEAAQYTVERNLVYNGDNLYRLCWDQRMKRIVYPHLSFDYQCQLMKKVKIPLLMILTFDFKRSQIKVVNPKLLYVFAESNPNFDLELVDGIHNVHLNDPESVTKFIGPFIRGTKLQHRDQTLENIAKFCTQISKM